MHTVPSSCPIQFLEPSENGRKASGLGLDRREVPALVKALVLAFISY